MAQVRGSAHVAATAMMILVTMSMLFQCQAAPTHVTWDMNHNSQSVSLKKGGQLMFDYVQGVHNVVNADGVNGYTNCQPGKNPITVTDPKHVFSFPKTGTFYYICTKPSHCVSGHGPMRVNVTVTN